MNTVSFVTTFVLLVSTAFATIATKEQFVASDSAQLYCKSMGEGAPLLVLHGGPGMSQDYLLPGMEELAKNRCAIFYDQRGCGKSQGPIDAATITIDNYIADIEAIRLAYGYEKISILGHSWGGHLALKYATIHPDRIDKLILVSSTPATTADFTLFLQEWYNRMTPYMQELHTLEALDAYKRGDTATVAKTYELIFKTYCANPNDVAKLNIENPPLANVRGKQTYTFIVENYLGKPFDLTKELQKLACKTLIVHGDFDPIPVACVKTIEKAIPNAKLVVLEQCGHFPYVEQQKLFNDYVETFFRDS